MRESVDLLYVRCLAKGDCGVAHACVGVVATSHFAGSAHGESHPR